jgi:hypothetical protein
MEPATHYILIDRIPVAVDIETKQGLIEWSLWMQNPDNCRVAESVIHSYRVSTFFLGRSHLYPPKLFQTIIFETNENTCLLIDDHVELIDQIKAELDRLMWEHRTWEEAEKGHLLVVDMVRRSIFEDHTWWNRVAKVKGQKSYR